MATVEIELRNYKKRKTEIVKGEKVIKEQADGLMPLVLRITSGEKVSRKNTGLYIKESEWDPQKRRVNRRNPKWTQINDALDALCREAEGIKADIIRDRKMVTPEIVMGKVFSFRDFYDAAKARRDSFGAEHAGNKGNYNRMIARLQAFAPRLMVEEITPEFLERFRNWMLQPTPDREAYAPNTVTSTFSKMRAVLKGLDLKGDNPFSKFAVGAYQAAEVDHLTMEDIRKIRNHIPRGKWQRVAKDTFLFSFYAAGMRSVDVLQLRWSNIKDGRIDWKQSKVKGKKNARLSIPLNQVTEDILNRQDRNRETVFGLVTMFGGSEAAMKERESIQASISSALKQIALSAGIGKNINFKLARTSFGRIANEASGRNVYGIQQAMGHGNIQTTEIYLGSDNRAVDELLQVVYA